MKRWIKIWTEFLVVASILVITLDLPEPYTFIGFIILGVVLMYYIMRKYKNE